MKGEWLKVAVNCFPGDESCNISDEQCKDALTVWIKWKEENKILIEIHQLL